LNVAEYNKLVFKKIYKQNIFIFKTELNSKSNLN